MAGKITPIEQMTSSEFVSHAAIVSRDITSWDGATDAFPGRPRWEPAEDKAIVSSSQETAQTPV